MGRARDQCLTGDPNSRAQTGNATRRARGCAVPRIAMRARRSDASTVGDSAIRISDFLLEHFVTSSPLMAARRSRGIPNSFFVKARGSAFCILSGLRGRRCVRDATIGAGNDGNQTELRKFPFRHAGRRRAFAEKFCSRFRRSFESVSVFFHVDRFGELICNRAAGSAARDAPVI